MKPHLVLVDLQQAFFDVRLEDLGRIGKAICLPGVRRLLGFAREKSWPITHVLTKHSGQATLPVRLRELGVPPFCVEGDPGSEPVAGLIGQGDGLVYKQVFSGAGRTDLEARIAEAPVVIVAGIAADCCVLHTAFDIGGTMGKRVLVPFQAVGASRLESYVPALEAIGKSAAAVVDIANMLSNDCWPEQTPPPVSRESLTTWVTAALARTGELQKEYERRTKESHLADALAWLESELTKGRD